MKRLARAYGLVTNEEEIDIVDDSRTGDLSSVLWGFASILRAFDEMAFPAGTLWMIDFGRGVPAAYIPV